MTKSRPTAEWEKEFKDKYEGANVWSSMGIESVIKDIHSLLKSQKQELIAKVMNEKRIVIKLGNNTYESYQPDRVLDRVIELIKGENNEDDGYPPSEIL